MLHFPSTLKSNGNLPKRTDSLNATQQRAGSHPIFSVVEEELHDARRVASHGQEEDLRAALGMVIRRVGELSSLLSEAYKTQADLEVQLNVAKSNLQLVIANNEMLEEALKQNSGGGNTRDVGWKRSGSVRRSNSAVTDPDFHRNSSSVETSSSENSPSMVHVNPAVIPIPPTPPQQQESGNSRFFRFRFNSASNSRPGTPHQPASPTVPFSSPSMPSLPVQQPSREKELEELMAQLEREREAHRLALKDKAALEEEIESLSQALFEEANKMVATERIKLYEAEEELKESRKEKEALKSALRVIEGENRDLRKSAPPSPSQSEPDALGSRTSSESEVARELLPGGFDVPEVEREPTIRPMTRARRSSSVDGIHSMSPQSRSASPTSFADVTIKPEDDPDEEQDPKDDKADHGKKEEHRYEKEEEKGYWEDTAVEEQDPWKDSPSPRPSTPATAVPSSVHRTPDASMTVLYAMR